MYGPLCRDDGNPRSAVAFEVKTKPRLCLWLWFCQRLGPSSKTLSSSRKS